MSEKFLSIFLAGRTGGTQLTSYSVVLSLETSAGRLTFSEAEAGCGGSPCLTVSASNINEDSLEITGISATFDNIQIVDSEVTEFSLDHLSLFARAGDVFVPGIPRKITRTVDVSLINAWWSDAFFGSRIIFQHMNDPPMELLQPALIREGDTFEIHIKFSDGILRLTEVPDHSAYIFLVSGGPNEKQKNGQQHVLQYLVTVALETISGSVAHHMGGYGEASEGVQETISGFGIGYEFFPSEIGVPLDLMGISFIFEDIKFVEEGQSELYLQNLYEFIMDTAQFELLTTGAGVGD